MSTRKQYRKRLRLEGFNYDLDGIYFVTIRIRENEISLGDIRQDRIVLNVYGHIVQSCWVDLPRFFPELGLDCYAIMPDHVHGLICLEKEFSSNGRRQNEMLSKIVGSFKSFSCRYINQVRGQQGKSIWLRSFHDRVVRSEDELARIRRYIIENPARLEFKTTDSP